VIEPKQIIRSGRKTIALVVNSFGDLIVRAPHIVSNVEIMNFVTKKQGWIKKKAKSISIFDEEYTPITMATGDTLLFLGDNYSIEVSDVECVFIDGKIIFVPDSLGDPREMLVRWLKEQALTIINERVDRFSKLMGVFPSALKITDAKARWGSCGQNNNLNFAWRLIMCHISVIDYVVVHELSHIDFKNHNKQFWIRVKTTLPQYQEEQNWLNINKKLMQTI